MALPKQPRNEARYELSEWEQDTLAIYIKPQSPDLPPAYCDHCHAPMDTFYLSDGVYRCGVCGMAFGLRRNG